MATKVNKTIGYTGGSEGLLTGIGTFFMMAGVSIFLASFFISYWTDLQFSPIWAITGIAGLLQGIIMYALCKAFSDVIRILKNQAGLQFSGKISEVVPTLGYACSACDTLIDNTESSCPSCHAKFE